MQQGGVPTPFDRNFGTKMASKAIDHLIAQVEEHTRPDGNYAVKDIILYFKRMTNEL